MGLEMAQENVWFDKWRYDDAETHYYEQKSGAAAAGAGTGVAGVGAGLGALAGQIAKARQDIQNSRALSGAVKGPCGGAGVFTVSSDVVNRIIKLETENSSLHKLVHTLESKMEALVERMGALECGGTTTSAPVPTSAAPASASTATAASQQTQEDVKEDDDDDDVDLFGSDDEDDTEAERIRAERVKAYTEKKSKKPGPIAKSSVLLDCKPWSDETDMKAMEAAVRSITLDGLRWGAAKTVPLAYGVFKLSILCTVEDEKVSIQDLSDQIELFEEYVQSVDVAAFNKI